MRAACSVFLFAAFHSPAYADANLPDFSLKAAKAPGGPSAWENPAQLSYLNNSGGESAYAVNAAFFAVFSNVPSTTIQPQLSAWVAKNTLTTNKQDKRGVEASVIFAGGTPQFGYVPEISFGADRDNVKKADERTAEASLNLIAPAINLGGCGRSIKAGCTYWDLLAGAYFNDVRASNTNTGLGHVNGSRVLAKLTSTPFGEGHPLAPLRLSASAQRQWDASASSMRVKETRSSYTAAISWRFYNPDSKVKPSISLKRVLGSDLLTGQDHQAYTQLTLELGI